MYSSSFEIILASSFWSLSISWRSFSISWVFSSASASFSIANTFSFYKWLKPKLLLNLDLDLLFLLLCPWLEFSLWCFVLLPLLFFWLCLRPYLLVDLSSSIFFSPRFDDLSLWRCFLFFADLFLLDSTSLFKSFKADSWLLLSSGSTISFLSPFRVANSLLLLMALLSRYCLLRFFISRCLYSTSSFFSCYFFVVVFWASVRVLLTICFCRLSLLAPGASRASKTSPSSTSSALSPLSIDDKWSANDLGMDRMFSFYNLQLW